LAAARRRGLNNFLATRNLMRRWRRLSTHCDPKFVSTKRWSKKRQIYGQNGGLFLMTKTTKIERSVLIKKELLSPNPWNPNKTTKRQQESIAESLEAYSQIIDIIVRPDPNNNNRYQIIDGEHRYDELGETVYATILHGLTDADAKKLTIILNEGRGKADKIDLAHLLADISLDLEPVELLNCLPYDQIELDELIKLADINWDDFGDSGSDQDDSAKSEEDEESEFIKLAITIPRDALLVAEQAYDLISNQRTLNKKKDIAWGQVLESLCADYLSDNFPDRIETD